MKIKGKKTYPKPRLYIKKISLINFYSKFSRQNELVDIEGGILLAQKSPNGSSCFLKNTNILIKNNKEVPIQTLKKNDIVISFNPLTQDIVEKKVESIKVSYEATTIYVINEGLHIAKKHQVFVKNYLLKQVEKIKIGDYLLNSNLHYELVKSIRKMFYKGIVYNLILKGLDQTFFAENILVYSGYLPIDKLYKKISTKNNENYNKIISFI